MYLKKQKAVVANHEEYDVQNIQQSQAMGVQNCTISVSLSHASSSL
jgi:hypothetical protein